MKLKQIKIEIKTLTVLADDDVDIVYDMVEQMMWSRPDLFIGTEIKVYTELSESELN